MSGSNQGVVRDYVFDLKDRVIQDVVVGMVPEATLPWTLPGQGAPPSTGTTVSYIYALGRLLAQVEGAPGAAKAVWADGA